MIRRSLLLILTLILVLSSVPVVVASDGNYYSESELESFKKSLDFYTHFGVTDEKAAASTISRREFTKIIVSYFYGIETGYTDAAKTLGFWNENETDETLNKDITFDEAQKYMVIGLGHIVTGEDYRITAQRLGVIKGVNAEWNLPITFFNILKMMDNSLEIKCIRRSLSGQDQYELTNSTVLDDVFKVRRKNGMITAVPDMGLVSSTVKDGYILIDNLIYKAECECDKNMVGHRVDYYVDKYDPDVVRFIGNDYSVTTTYDAEDIVSYKNREYEVYRANTDSKKYILLDKSAYIMYNGRPALNITVQSMVPRTGRVVFIDNNKDNAADVVMVYSFDIKKITTIDYENMTLYFDGMDSVNLNEVEYLSIVNNGNNIELPFKSIKLNRVIFMGRSDDNGVIIELLPDTISGNIQYLSNDSIKINDVVYPFIHNWYCETGVKVGDKGTFFIDSLGRVVAMTDRLAEKRLGYLINAAKDDGIMGTYRVKIFDDSGNMQIITASEKINVDNVKGDGERLLAALKKGENKVIPQLVCFSLNSQGELTKIDTAYNYSIREDYRDILPPGGEMADSFRITYSSELQNEGELIYYERMKSFQGKFGSSGEQLVFVIPNDPISADEDDFMLMNISDLSESRYNVDAYSFDSKAFAPDAFVIHGENSIKRQEFLGMVAEITKELGDDGNIVQRVVAYGPPGMDCNALNYDLDLDNVPRYYGSDGKTYKLDVGDFAYFIISNDKIADIKMVLDVESGDYNPNDHMFNGWMYTTYGAVYEKENGLISIAPLDKLAEIEVLNEQLKTAADADVNSILMKISSIERNFIVYSPDDYRQIGVYKNRHGDLEVTADVSNTYIPYTDSTTDYSKVIMLSSEAYTKSCYVYQNN